MAHRAVFAGFLDMMCVCMVMLLPSADAASCQAKELTDGTRSMVNESLVKFDEANGKHLGTWSPGFPELQVHRNSPVVQSKVQCSLIFMAQGLGKVLEDQRSNLNPLDVSLHKELKNAIARINMLANCLKSVYGGECSSPPPPPTMPRDTFERKQWSHTLLKTSTVYLEWLHRTLKVYKGTNNTDSAQSRHQGYREGSEYLL
ncbi:uncharacterized protein LOC129604595 [Betta splendens]|uniref:Uncharacterized protein LOC129604595 n=1 Tax=Betta splendens TaxID=158456 RepID=A0A9W2Y111_BETSP|nr:uncharacterized protein LOC129604595 [Betta splendens]